MKTRERFASLVEHYGGQAAVAEKLNVAVATVNHLVHGRNNPNVQTSIAIEKLFGIPVADWPSRARRRPRK